MTTLRMSIATPEQLAALGGHIQANATPPNFQPMAAFLQDEDGALYAGVYGYHNHHWLYIDTLWVDEKRRGQGLGRQMMDAIEQAALGRGIKHAFLGTYEFQALGFYRQLGYTVVGQSPVAGETNYVMTKSLEPKSLNDNQIPITLESDDALVGQLSQALHIYTQQYTDMAFDQQAIVAVDETTSDLAGGLLLVSTNQEILVNAMWLADAADSSAIAAQLLAHLEQYALDSGRQAIICRTDDPALQGYAREAGYSELFAIPHFPNERPMVALGKRSPGEEQLSTASEAQNH